MRVIYKLMHVKGYEDSVIALFPEIAGDSCPYSTCLSYMHVGQHGAASVELASYPPARPTDYRELHNELTKQVGYDLTISNRFSQKDLDKRILQTTVNQ